MNVLSCGVEESSDAAVVAIAAAAAVHDIEAGVHHITVTNVLPAAGIQHAVRFGLSWSNGGPIGVVAMLLDDPIPGLKRSAPAPPVAVYALLAECENTPSTAYLKDERNGNADFKTDGDREGVGAKRHC